MAASGAARAVMAAGGLLKGYLAPYSAGTGALALPGHLTKGGLLQHRAVSSLVPVAAAAARAPLRGLGGALAATAAAATPAGGRGLGLAAAARQAAVAEARIGGGAMEMTARAILETSSKYDVAQVAAAAERRKRLTCATLGALGLMLSGFALCWGEYRTETVPYTGRSHIIALVPSSVAWVFQLDWLQSLSPNAYLRRFLTRVLPDNHPDVARVRRVGAAVVTAAASGAGGGSWEHVHDIKWQFAVWQDPHGVAAAAVTANGQVVVTADLLRDVGGDDDALAAVLAHEAGHVLARQFDERIVTFLPLLFVSSMLLLVRPPGFVRAITSATLPEHLYTMHCSRRDEYEADHIGVHLTARAGYNPAGFVTFLERLSEKEEEALAGLDFIDYLRYKRNSLIWDTHPPTPDRIARVTQQLHLLPARNAGASGWLWRVAGQLRRGNVFPAVQLLPSARTTRQWAHRAPRRMRRGPPGQGSAQ